jgi:Rieske Fe-S protein
MEAERDSARRRFITWLLSTGVGGMALAVVYPVVRFLVPPRSGEPSVASVTIPWKPAELRPNSGRIFRFGGQPGLLVRTPGGELRAFNAICTHLNCTVQYRQDRHDIWCACHNGVYDLTGRNVSGPPPRPLEPFKVNVGAEQITIAKA